MKTLAVAGYDNRTGQPAAIAFQLSPERPVMVYFEPALYREPANQ